MSQPAFDAVVVGYMGFTETVGANTGIAAIWSALRSLSSPRVFVHSPLAWDDNAEERAAFLASVTDADSVIAIYAYSWGAGWGATRLCEALERRGRRVALLVMIDPVYRSPLLIGRFRSLMNRVWAPVITLPDSVERVVVLAQGRDKPQAHDVILRGRTVPVEYVAGVGHRTIDNDIVVLQDVYHEVSTAVRDALKPSAINPQLSEN
ncbi:MAG: hypothetical protein AAFY08_14080 [Planctomycetota bacterium]